MPRSQRIKATNLFGTILAKLLKYIMCYRSEINSAIYFIRILPKQFHLSPADKSTSFHDILPIGVDICRQVWYISLNSVGRGIYRGDLADSLSIFH